MSTDTFYLYSPHAKTMLLYRMTFSKWATASLHLYADRFGIIKFYLWNVCLMHTELKHLANVCSVMCYIKASPVCPLAYCYRLTWFSVGTLQEATDSPSRGSVDRCKVFKTMKVSTVATVFAYSVTWSFIGVSFVLFSNLVNPTVTLANQSEFDLRTYELLGF